MKHQNKPLLAVLILLIVSIFPITAAWAVPFESSPSTYFQPDGTTFKAGSLGNCQQVWTKTATGYSIIRDEDTGYWVYAQVDSEGKFEKTSLLVGIDEPVGIKKHLYAKLVRREPLIKLNSTYYQPGGRRSHVEPLGTTIYTKRIGGQWNSWEITRGSYSVPDGYAILKDKDTGYCVYAKLNSERELEKTSLRVGIDKPVGIKKFDPKLVKHEYVIKRISTYDQPDGATFRGHGICDQWRCWDVTLGGYAIIRDEDTGYWVYAKFDLEGKFEKTPLIVGIDKPKDIKRWLKPEPPTIKPESSFQTVKRQRTGQRQRGRDCSRASLCVSK